MAAGCVITSETGAVSRPYLRASSWQQANITLQLN